jgi:hypothetical protein
MYIHPRTIMGDRNREHVVRILNNIVPNYPGHANAGAMTSFYQFKVVCSCQFEVLCRDQAEADMWKAQHLSCHGVSAAVEVAPTLRSPHDPTGSGNPHATADNKVVAVEPKTNA